MTRLRVLHVIPSLSPRRGGPSHAAVQMVAALNRTHLVDARILTTTDDVDDVLAVTSDAWVTFGEAPVWFLERASPPVRTLREYAFARSLLPWLRVHAASFDVLHVHAVFSYLPSMAMAHARRHGLPYVVRPIGQLNHWALAQSRLRKALYLALVERRNLDGASRIQFTSDLEQAEAAALGLCATGAVIPLGIAADPVPAHAREALIESYGLRAEAPIALFLGRLHEKKGITHLLRAIATDSQGMQLLIAGEGMPDHEATLKALVRELGIETRVRWLGFVEGTAKQALLAGADVFALTSHSENFGIAVAEALAAGTPVVVTRGVALSEFVAKAALGYVCELDVADIARGLRLAAQCDATARAQRRDKTLEKFGWPSVAQALVALYQQVTGPADTRVRT